MTRQSGQDRVQEKADVQWTKEQQRVIDAREKSLLVSAAAGSGKTAVLVQRILSLITDPADPIDVDELLVVTFTKAAAAEMRERILIALTEAARLHPDEMHLQRQMALVHNAQITTVDSFCLEVVTNHFHRISLEPGFRIADAGELLLLQEDVCESVLTEFYQEGSPAFERFADGYSDAKSDRKIREMILTLYSYAQSYPWPDEWLDTCAVSYEAGSKEELEKKEWVRDYLAYLHQLALNMAAQCRKILAVSEEEGGPYTYKETLSDDLSSLEMLCLCESLSDWQRAISSISFQSLKGAGKGGLFVEEEKKTYVQTVRNQIKKQIGALKEVLKADLSTHLALLAQTGEMVRMLCEMTKVFSKRFAQEKAKKNLLDFSDVEHFALQILVDPDTKKPTQTAREYRQRFREVMIDEYQDSNYLQEEILTAVSKIPDGRQNLFMVGDVKQSIYRFRQARPDLFLHKYETFPREDDAPTQRIDLHKNFRSRPEILGIVNDLFARIMGRDLGNVEYDAEAALYQGRETRDDDSDAYRPECLLVERAPGEEARLAEAGAIARRIRRMVGERELPGLQYRDIVILLRSMKDWPQDFVTAFEQEGVPLLVTSLTGYFSAQEVQVVLAMLRVIDNPGQDIPLATLLRSPIGGFSDEEMARIKTADPDAPFFVCVRKVAEDETHILHEKTARFWKMISDFRDRMPYTPIHLLIQQIYDETGYRDLVTALPAGEQRRANLDMLLERAAAYEKTSYHGLYHFVRYIDRLIKDEVDIGEAETVSEQENAVRLMTIHKSKGLEFPVVFVAGMGRQFNRADASGDMVFHPKYGVGFKLCDAKKRTKTDTLIRQAFSVEAKKESLGEELRILYVALTRAKDKLILTGMDPERERAADSAQEPYQKLDFMLRFNAAGYFDWVLPALSTYGDAYQIETAGPARQEREHIAHSIQTAQKREALRLQLQDVDEALLGDLQARFLWEYPHPVDGMSQKMSVSEIKHRAMEEAGESLAGEEGETLFSEQIPTPYIPKFIQEPEENGGALTGTAFHRLMECLDFASLPDFTAGSGTAQTAEAKRWVCSEIERLERVGRIRREDAARIDPHQTGRFLTSELARRMAQAAGSGLLVREQPFVMSLAADQLWPGTDPEETVLIQGIIDVFWEEEDGLVLMDYKTDSVKTPKELIARYQTQLQLYAQALSRRFHGRCIKETVIYSFCLGEEILLT